MIRRSAAIVFLLAGLTAAHAEEPSGCDAFKWSLDTERRLLATPVDVAPGAELDRNAGSALKIALAPLASAGLVMAPERAPKNAVSYATALRFAGAKDAGVLRLTLSDAAWIDVIQGGKFLAPRDFTGAHDCPGVRKSVEFAIGPEPFVLQLSDAASPAISLAITEAK